MRTQPYLPPATRAMKGNHRSGWGLAQLHGNQRWSVPLDVPRHFLPAAPMGCDGSPGIPRFQRSAYGWAEVSLSHTADHRPAGCRPAVPERPSRSLPIGRSWRDFWIGFGSSPRSGNGLDEVRIRLSRFRERLSGGEVLRKSPSIYKPRESPLFMAFFQFFQKTFLAAHISAATGQIWRYVAPPLP